MKTPRAYATQLMEPFAQILPPAKYDALLEAAVDTLAEAMIEDQRATAGDMPHWLDQAIWDVWPEGGAIPESVHVLIKAFGRRIPPSLRGQNGSR